MNEEIVLKNIKNLSNLLIGVLKDSMWTDCDIKSGKDKLEEKTRKFYNYYVRSRVYLTDIEKNAKKLKNSEEEELKDFVVKIKWLTKVIKSSVKNDQVIFDCTKGNWDIDFKIYRKKGLKVYENVNFLKNQDDVYKYMNEALKKKYEIIVHLENLNSDINKYNKHLRVKS